MSTYALFGLDYMEEILTDQYVNEVLEEKARTKWLGTRTSLIWISAAVVVYMLFFIPINRRYQAARNNLLLVTDSVLVSSESIMFKLFGEKRKEEMQRRQELARRFRMVK